MADPPSVEHNALTEEVAGEPDCSARIQIRDLARVIRRHGRAFGAIWACCLLLCLAYWLATPNRYESRAKIAALGVPAQTPSLEGQPGGASLTGNDATLRQASLASVLRGEGLAWKVIVAQKLYEQPAFAGRFSRRFPGFKSEAPDPEARNWLLRRFAKSLYVQLLPRTVLVEVGFRSSDAGLSAQAVRALLQAYSEQSVALRLETQTHEAKWLDQQAALLKAQVNKEQERLFFFQRAHGLLITPESSAENQTVEVQHSPVILEVDEMGRQLAAAISERILREAEYQSALHGDPELIGTATSHLQAEPVNLSTVLLQKIRSARSDLEQESALLKTEHGPNYPRVAEIANQLRDLERQNEIEDRKLVESYRAAWQTAQERESRMRSRLEERMVTAIEQSRNAAEYASMRKEAESYRGLYLRVKNKSEEAAVAAGMSLPDYAIADPPTLPSKPVSPNLLVDFSIALFGGFWLSFGGIFLLEPLGAAARRRGAVLLLLLASLAAGAQAPTPSTSGLPTGVARLPFSHESKSVPNAQESPAVWTGNTAANAATPSTGGTGELQLPAPISAGDLVTISEFHTPEFRTQGRVSKEGSVRLPFLGEIVLAGLDESAAARSIEAALVEKGILLHPNVNVLVTAYAGQDVSVLGEVARPGVYPFTAHHRLLDLISAAAGLTPTAGSLVNITRRDDPRKVHPVVLDPTGSDFREEHNPELQPGDTVQVSRAGLVYVVGAVIRPGGFTVDPGQKLTVAQAVSLAWGPSQNANPRKAVLIREQAGGRIVIEVNLKRILRGEESGQSVFDHDILFVPDSTAKTLWNRTVESAIQSLVGVSIYSGLVYSQRY